MAKLTIEAKDGHRLGAYMASPTGTSKGGVVVLQEIFGVNAHIRDVCDRFAAQGYHAVAPALYDRSSLRDAELDYTKDDVQRGRALREEFSWDDTMLDVHAAIDELSKNVEKVATVGFCWGGTIAFLSATRLPVAGAVVYYGGQIVPYVEERAKAPLLMHFGSRDASIPPEMIDQIRNAHPQAAIHVYDADHGFNCDRRGSHDETAASLAGKRTLAFFEDVLS